MPDVVCRLQKNRNKTEYFSGSCFLYEYYSIVHGTSIIALGVVEIDSDAALGQSFSSVQYINTNSQYRRQNYLFIDTSSTVSTGIPFSNLSLKNRFYVH